MLKSKILLASFLVETFPLIQPHLPIGFFIKVKPGWFGRKKTVKSECPYLIFAVSNVESNEFDGVSEFVHLRAPERAQRPTPYLSWRRWLLATDSRFGEKMLCIVMLGSG